MSDYSSILESTSEHSHTLDNSQNIDRQVIREICKTKANDSISIKPIKIIEKELMVNVNTILNHKDFISIKKAMYDKRQKHIPPFSKSWKNAITQFKSIQNDDFFFKFRRKQFVHFPDDNSCECLTTEDNIVFMASCTYLFADGTTGNALKFFL